MNQSARVQCQPHLTWGLPLPTADLSESSRELLETLAPPDQRSSTDFNPVPSPSSPLRALGRGCSSHTEGGMHLEPLSWCCAASAGAAPSQPWVPRCTQQDQLKIWEKSLLLPPPGMAGSSLWSLHSSGVRVKTCSAGKVPEPPPTTSLPMGLFLLKGEEKVVLWLFVMERSFCGGERNPKSWAVADSEPLCPGSCGCAYITALCSCSNTSKA